MAGPLEPTSLPTSLPAAPTRQSPTRLGPTRFAFVLWTCAVVVVVGAVIWFLSYQQPGLAEPRYASDFFDAQARSWLRGTWSIPQEVLGLEGIRTDGGLQMYFGPFPSALRLPILLVTDRLDGRLTQPSILVAYLIFLLATTRLWWQIRALTRGTAPITRVDGLVAAGMVLVVGIGSPVLILTTTAQVYTEAIAWGLALAMVAFSLLLACLRSYRHTTAALAIAAAAAATLSRVGTGGGAMVAIWLIGGAWLLARVTGTRTGAVARAGKAVTSYLVAPVRAAACTTRQCAMWLGGAAAGSAMYLGVNVVRFGTLLSIPWEGFVFGEQSTRRATALAANDGSLTGIQFLPTTLLTYLRPDGVSLDDLFPWISFPRHDVTGVGGVVLDATPPTGSLSATMPLLVLLAAVGAGVILVPRLRGAGDHAVLRPLLIGALAGTVPMLAVGFIAHRYLVDAMPVLLIGAFAGIQTLWHWLGRSDRERWRTGAVVAMCILALWSIMANLALAVDYQHLEVPLTPDVRYEFLQLQYAGRGPSDALVHASVVPPPGQRGTLLAIGDCEALLWSNGDRWLVIEGSLSDEAWSPDPSTKFFDRFVAGALERGDPVLCRALRDGLTSG